MSSNSRGLVAFGILVVLLLAVPVLGGGMVAPGMMGGFAGAPAAGGSWGLAVGLGWLTMLAFWGALIVGVVLLVRWLGGTTGGAGRVAGQAALDILRRRYAAGEITKEQYEEMRQVLER